MKMTCVARSFMLFGIVAIALSGAARAGGSDVLVLTEGQVETITAGSAVAAGEATALAAGSPTITGTSADTASSAGRIIEAATAEAAAIAAGSATAGTLTTSSSYSDGGDAGGSAVLVSSSGSAAGDKAYATSSTSTRAISTPGANVAVGTGQSFAKGGDYKEADASISVIGADVTQGHSVSIVNPALSLARAAGVAVSVHNGTP